MCGCAAAPRGFETLGGPSQGRPSGPGAHHDPRTVVVALLKAGHQSLTSDGAEFIGEGPVEDQDVHSKHPLTDGSGVLQDKALVNEKNATQHEGDHRPECQGDSEMRHPVIERGHSHSIREDTLETHEQQPGRERHARSHVVQGLGMVHLEVADHDQADGVGAAGHEGTGVDPAPVAVLDHLGVSQKAHHHHHEGTHVPDQTEEAALGRVRSTLTDEGYVLDGATCFGKARAGQLLQAGYIVGPVFHRTNMVIHHSHGVNDPYPCDGEGRQADRQDDPGSHWAGSEQTVSGAWGEREGGLGAGEATQHEEGGEARREGGGSGGTV